MRTSIKTTGKLVGDPGRLGGTGEWKVIEGEELTLLWPIINGFLDSVEGEFVCGGRGSNSYSIEVRTRKQKHPKFTSQETVVEEINKFLRELAGLKVCVEVEAGKSLVIREV